MYVGVHDQRLVLTKRHRRPSAPSQLYDTPLKFCLQGQETPSNTKGLKITQAMVLLASLCRVANYCRNVAAATFMVM